MSHYTTVTSDFDGDNKECLIEAIKETWPKATILQNARVRGYRGTRMPKADIVIRFTNPTQETQGNYDIGFTKKADGKYTMVADWGYLHPSAADPKTGRRGSHVVNSMLKAKYTEKVIMKKVTSSRALRGYKNVSRKKDYIVRKNAQGKEIKYKRLRFANMKAGN